MVVLLLLGYAAICVAVFRFIKVPVTQWTVTTAGLGGVVIVGGLLLAMNYNHPFTTDARIMFFTTPIIFEVKGRVIEVPIESNIKLKKGNPLFRINPEPFQYIVDQKKAELAAAEQSVKQLKAALDQASAGVEKAEAQVLLAKQDYDRQAELFEKQVVAKARLDTATRNLETTNQSLAQAQAVEQSARLAYTSEVGGVNTSVARLRAIVQDAEYDLEQTIVRAPTDGYVTHLFLQPGMIAGTAPAMVFVHDNDATFLAAFRQSVAQRLRPGLEAEIAFNAVPGRVFKGKVNSVNDAVSQGQLQATNTLLNVEEGFASTGLVLTIIDVTEDVSGYRLPVGSSAQVAIYTDHWKPVAAIRRILLRMKSWVNYI